MNALLGDVFVVDTLETPSNAPLRDTPGSRFITPEGIVVWPSGKVTVGASRRRFAGRARAQAPHQ